MLRTEKSVFFDDFLRTRGLLYWMYCARTVAENGEKDAFSVISDNEWNPYGFAVRFITFAVQIDFYAEIFVRKEKYELCFCFRVRIIH